MRILHVVASVNRETGGPAFSVTRLAAEQAKLGHEVTVAALDYKRHGPAVDPAPAKLDLTKADFLAVHGRGWSPAFARRVRELTRNVDVVHNHALWMWPNKYARCAANEAGKPLVISTRGMLEDWSLRRAVVRKFVAWHLFERKNLESAALFHATSDSEAEAIKTALRSRLRSKYGELSVKGDRRWEIGDRGTDSAGGGRWKVEGCEFGIRNSEIGKKLSALSVSAVQKGYRRGAESAEGWPRRSGALQSDSSWPRIVVAPNGVDIQERIPKREVLEARFAKLRGKKWILFMSRVHPKKGLLELAKAWMQIKGSHPDLELVIAGPEQDKGYAEKVRAELKGEGVWTGELGGEQKWAALGNAGFMVLPSYSENFGIVVAESLAAGRPVLTTTGTPWGAAEPEAGGRRSEVGGQRLEAGGQRPEGGYAGWDMNLERNGCGVICEVSGLKEAMGKMISFSDVQLDEMGRKGKKMVAERFSWKAAAEKVVEAYEELVDRR